VLLSGRSKKVFGHEVWANKQKSKTVRIDQIRIKNFKGFEDKEFALHPRFTVFIGDNAKGKTSVLDAIAVAAGSFLHGIDVARHEARSIAQAEIRVKSIDGQPKPQLPVEIEAFGTINERSIQGGWKRTIEEVTSKATTTYVQAKEVGAIASQMLSQSRSKGGITFPVIAYHGTGRLWAEHEKRKVPYRKQHEGVEMAYAKCLSPKSSSKEFLSWYKTYEDEARKFNNETDRMFLDVFNQCIISMIPHANWQDMAYSFKDEDLIGTFVSPEGIKERLLFSQLSDGYRNVIGMAADIAYRCIKLNPHLGREAIEKTPGIVLIDELDLHLHPNWQRSVVADLKRTFKNIQFVATTHSPFIVQSLESSELVNLDRVTDVKLKDLSIGEVAENVMGAKDEMSIENARNEKLSADYLSKLQTLSNGIKEEAINELNQIEQQISDPAVRAFLKMKRLEKNN
jgi:predicted ATP-binding protein involved in virulence